MTNAILDLEAESGIVFRENIDTEDVADENGMIVDLLYMGTQRILQLPLRDDSRKFVDGFPLLRVDHQTNPIVVLLKTGENGNLTILVEAGRPAAKTLGEIDIKRLSEAAALKEA